MTPELAVQKAIRAALVAAAPVPANNILDRNQRPAPTPSIILGEALAVDEGTDLARRRTRVFHTLHIWTREAGLVQVAGIVGAIRAALHGRRDAFTLDAPFHAIDVRVADLRTMRDPDGETGHGVVTVDVLVQEIAA